ncbi:MAG: serine/threonine protein kinase, partial [Chitinophagaceae bacterium]|nr:serine/threonine protein kinase [Chitinophagaceae bacterium]
ILNFTIFLDCFGMVASSATIFMLRKRTRNLDNQGIYKMKLYPLFPVLFILTYLFVGISIAIQTPETALTGVVVLAAFIGLYFITKSIQKRKE